jgi:hypothetical protein
LRRRALISVPVLALALALAAAAASNAKATGYISPSAWRSLLAAPTLAPPATITVTPVRPYQPGDPVWMTTPPAPTGPSIQAAGCQRVPSSGYIGSHVYASSTVQYSNYWSWSTSSSLEPFSWYVKTTSGTIVASGSSGGAGGSSSVAVNNLYWQVQNTGATPQAWTVCSDIR